MGQYYKAIVQNDHKTITMQPWHYDSGGKLTEHGWMGNWFTNAVISRIENNPAKVGWIGDYSNDQNPHGRSCPDSIYKKVWKDEEAEDDYKVNIYDRNLFLKLDEDGHIVDTVGLGFLINRTKRQYIDLEAYAKEAKDHDSWALSPLPMLTAVGNGLGGGDYHGCNQDMVGYWFMDVLEFSREKKPTGYTDITMDCIFKE